MSAIVVITEEVPLSHWCGAEKHDRGNPKIVRMDTCKYNAGRTGYCSSVCFEDYGSLLTITPKNKNRWQNATCLHTAERRGFEPLKRF